MFEKRTHARARAHPLISDLNVHKISTSKLSKVGNLIHIYNNYHVYFFPFFRPDFFYGDLTWKPRRTLKISRPHFSL